MTSNTFLHYNNYTHTLTQSSTHTMAHDQDAWMDKRTDISMKFSKGNIYFNEKTVVFHCKSFICIWALETQIFSFCCWSLCIVLVCILMMMPLLLFLAMINRFVKERWDLVADPSFLLNLIPSIILYILKICTHLMWLWCVAVVFWCNFSPSGRRSDTGMTGGFFCRD